MRIPMPAWLVTTRSFASPWQESQLRSAKPMCGSLNPVSVTCDTWHISQAAKCGPLAMAKVVPGKSDGYSGGEPLPWTLTRSRKSFAWQSRHWGVGPGAACHVVPASRAWAGARSIALGPAAFVPSEVWQVVQTMSCRVATSGWHVAHASVTGVDDTVKDFPSACVSVLVIGNHLP